MRRTIMMRLLPLAGAVVLAFGLVSSVSAAPVPARAAVPLTTLEASPNAGAAWSVLEHLLASGLLPAPAAEAVAGVLLDAEGPDSPDRNAVEPNALERDALERERSREGHGSPSGAGLVCRRVAANPDLAPDELVERCRDWLAGSGEGHGISPAEACRRVAQSDSPAQWLVDRCRTWLNGLDDTSDGAQACRRVANADGVDGSLIERCREWLQGQQDDAVGVSACRRLAAAEDADPALVERCRAAVADQDTRERPERERPERERPERAGSDLRDARSAPGAVRIGR